MRARHLVTLGIGIGIVGAGGAFVACGTDTFGTCQDTLTCAEEGGTSGEGGGNDSPSGSETGTNPEGGEAGKGDGGGGESGVVEAGEAGCPSSTPLDCNGTCVDNTTITNCGTCGNACTGPEAGPGSPACMPGGQCAVVCDNDGGDASPTEILCNSACVSPDDPTHCGTCTNTCQAPPSGNGTAVCPAAQCTVSCTSGYHPAGINCSSDCLADTDDPSTDPCAVADGLGLFVSPTGSDTAPGDGTKEHPYATITHALTKGLRIYACGTLTAEPQPLAIGAAVDGATIYGGFDCTTWAYSASTKTKMAPAATGLVVVINGLTTGVTFEDFEFDALAATGAGGTSQTVVVNGSQGVVFRRTNITAGAAGPKGSDGSPGTNSWSGVANSGNSASSTEPDHGGATQTNCTCGGTGGQGGAAGTWNSSTLTVLGSGSNGEPGTIGTATNGGVGAHQGVGGPPAVVPCAPGTAGNGGGSGTGGAGGSAPGALSVSGWSNPGGTGAAGQPGGAAQGGGGGGGGLYDPALTPNGAGGSAGGGCGGCGGIGGASGGSPGGSSIPLIVISSAVTLDTCTLNAGAGSAGGMGGSGQAGQSGGPPGSPATSGCNGGSGGSGGTGGAAGGGAGGHSIGVAYHGTAPTQVGTATINISTAGAAGAAGNGVSTGTSVGAPGIAAQTQSF